MRDSLRDDKGIYLLVLILNLYFGCRANAFGVPFLANPDLPERLRRNAPLNPPDQSTFYAPGPKG